MRKLLANLIELKDQAEGCEELLARYNGEFAPDRWHMTAQEWPDVVSQRLIDYMKEKLFHSIVAFISFLKNDFNKKDVMGCFELATLFY